MPAVIVAFRRRFTCPSCNKPIVAGMKCDGYTPVDSARTCAACGRIYCIDCCTSTLFGIELICEECFTLGHEVHADGVAQAEESLKLAIQSWKAGCEEFGIQAKE